jgi:hypothetical protein
MQNSNNSKIGKNSQNGSQNTYDSALKQLVNILKSKANDNLKQLEDLWDSINCAAQITKIEDNVTNKPSQGLRTSPTPSSSSRSPITSMSDNSNDSNSSTGSSSMKRDISKITNPPPANRYMKKSKIEISTKNNSIENNSKQHLNGSKKTVKMSITKTKEQTNNNSMDMLDDYTCIVCKQLNQELHNKLVECRKCTGLYHQQCHLPRIRNDEIEDKDFEECSTCKISFTMDQKSENTEIMSLTRPTNNNNNIFSNLSNNNIDLNSSPSDSNTKSTTGTKGLAGLATKFNNGTTNNNQDKSKISKSNELFNLGKKKPSNTSNTSSIINKLKANQSPLLNGPKKSGLFNLSNGLNTNQKSGINLPVKEPKKMNNIQQNAPNITSSINARSKIS